MDGLCSPSSGVIGSANFCVESHPSTSDLLSPVSLQVMLVRRYSAWQQSATSPRLARTGLIRPSFSISTCIVARFQREVDTLHTGVRNLVIKLSSYRKPCPRTSASQLIVLAGNPNSGKTLTKALVAIFITLILIIAMVMHEKRTIPRNVPLYPSLTLSLARK